MADARHIGALAGGQMIAQEQLVGFLVHFRPGSADVPPRHSSRKIPSDWVPRWIPSFKIKNRQCLPKPALPSNTEKEPQSLVLGYDNGSPARRESPQTDIGIFQTENMMYMVVPPFQRLLPIYHQAWHLSRGLKEKLQNSVQHIYFDVRNVGNGYDRSAGSSSMRAFFTANS